VRKLTIEEKRHYDERGYVLVSNLFSAEELGEINEELDAIDVPQKSGEHEGFTYQLAMLTDKTKHFAHDERILNLIEDIVQPGIAIFSSKLLTKQPRSATVCHWHQDDAYYTEVVDSHTRMSIWAPLQDTDERNGCLWIVPGSHKQGLQPYTVKNNDTCRKALDVEQVDLSKAEPVRMQAGSILLFNALTWHSSNGNETDQVRRAFIVSYQEATVPVGRGKQHIVLRPAI
jgi:ectoine hydroxylase-related dioxygenase (phytanoyl-CoA dioxygenase family)